MSAAPALYRVAITHVRSAPKKYALRHRTYMWLIDPDHPPELPPPLRPLARFEPRDHFTGDHRSLRAGLEAFLGECGVDLSGGPVVMLTHARVLGYVFNPLTLYWCLDPGGAPRCIVAEVHNTYGGRHHYLLRPDSSGTAVTDKEFYVSPFFPVDGRYRMRLPAPGDRVDLTVHLERDGTRPFTATVRGSRHDARTATLLRLALGRPWSTLAVAAAIRLHGIRLYLRGLPVHPRPDLPARPHGPEHRTPENGS
ncbi:DUF1365 domain-containing protein [Streptomyces sp. NPDC050095]|uniref:DUF1365 domain-containing protein n=1 Tax=unclassified Streptomyces TaxID=2593676 RepID=UPI003424B5E7